MSEQDVSNVSGGIPRGDEPKRQVLVIEDNAVIAKIYEIHFGRHGWRTTTVTNGLDGLVTLRQCHWDLVLLDIMLPEMNGLEVLGQIRSEPGFDRLPVVVFTNCHLPDVEQRALEMGANAVFAKTQGSQSIIRHAIELAQQVAGAQASAEASALTGSFGVPVEPVGLGAGASPSTQPQPPATPWPLGQPSSEAFVAASRPPAGAAPLASSPLFHSDDPLVQAQAKEIARIRAEIRQNAGLPRRLRKAGTDEARRAFLSEMYRIIHALDWCCPQEFTHIREVASVAEAWLMQMHERPELVTPGCGATLERVMDQLARWLDDRSQVQVPTTAGCQVTIIADDADVLMALKSGLDACRMQSRAFRDPDEAMAFLGVQLSHLVVCDTKLPAADGIALARQLRAGDGPNRHTPILLVSSDATADPQTKCAAIGNASAIGRPVQGLEFALHAMLALAVQPDPSTWQAPGS